MQLVDRDLAVHARGQTASIGRRVHQAALRRGATARPPWVTAASGLQPALSRFDQSISLVAGPVASAFRAGGLARRGRHSRRGLGSARAALTVSARVFSVDDGKREAAA
jgi:hypothetical protein